MTLLLAVWEFEQAGIKMAYLMANVCVMEVLKYLHLFGKINSIWPQQDM